MPEAEPGDQRAEQHRRHQPGVEHVVADPERVLLPAGVPPLLQAPRALQRAPDRARPELVEVLAQPRGRRVLGGGHADVVAPVVLDVEVAVEALRQRDLGQPALVLLALVAELVGGVDADAADAADGDGQPDLVDGGQVATDAERVAARDEVHRAHEAGVLDRQEEVGDPAVVLVLLQGLDRVVRRVGAVQAGDQVDRGHDHQDHHRADPEPGAEAGPQPQPVAREGQGRHHQPDQPEVALVVAPRLRGSLGNGAVGDGVHDPLPRWSSLSRLVYRNVSFVNSV